MAEAWIGLGANLGQPLEQLRQAVRLVADQPQVELLAVSSCYRSAPWGDTEQPPFINAVVKLRTRLSPMELLQACQQIEKKLGRIRDPQRPWGPRKVDLDLLLYDELELNSETLTLPHPWMQQRAFVLQPLLELWPQACLPNGLSLAEALEGLNEHCTRLTDSLLPEMK